MPVTFIVGVESLSCTRLNGSPVVGRTLSSVVAEKSFKENLGLAGGETAEVKPTGGTFKAVASNYVLQDGDEVRFSRASGEKGLN